MKPVLESSFYLKIKNESNLLISMVGMIDPLYSNSERHFKKSFNDYLEVVTHNLDLHWLKDRVCQKSNPHPGSILEHKKGRVDSGVKKGGAVLCKKAHINKNRHTSLFLIKDNFRHLPYMISTVDDFGIFA